VPDSIFSVIFGACLVASAVFAFIFGAKPERIGGGLLLASYAATIAIRTLSGASVPTFGWVAVDLTLAIGFGALAWRYNLFWAGVAAVFSTLLVAFEGSRAFNFPLSPYAYFSVLNLAGYGVVFAVAAGTWSRRWGRRGDGE
jgi:hypothetical protein